MFRTWKTQDLLLYGRKWKSPLSFPSSIIRWLSCLIPCHKRKKKKNRSLVTREEKSVHRCWVSFTRTSSLFLFYLWLWDRWIFLAWETWEREWRGKKMIHLRKTNPLKPLNQGKRCTETDTNFICWYDWENAVNFTGNPFIWYIAIILEVRISPFHI